MTSADGEI